MHAGSSPGVIDIERFKDTKLLWHAWMRSNDPSLSSTLTRNVSRGGKDEKSPGEIYLKVCKCRREGNRDVDISDPLSEYILAEMDKRWRVGQYMDATCEGI